MRLIPQSERLYLVQRTWWATARERSRCLPTLGTARGDSLHSIRSELKRKKSGKRWQKKNKGILLSCCLFQNDCAQLLVQIQVERRDTPGTSTILMWCEAADVCSDGIGSASYSRVTEFVKVSGSDYWTWTIYSSVAFFSKGCLRRYLSNNCVPASWEIDGSAELWYVCCILVDI